MFVAGKPFQPSLMLSSNAGAYPSEALFRCSALCYTPCITHKGLPGKNTLAHYKYSNFTAVESCITLGPGVTFNPDEIRALASGGINWLGISEWVGDLRLGIFISAIEKFRSWRARHLKNAFFCLRGDRKD